ncbi:hypothetical protein ACSVC9_05740 [Clostridium sp. LBM24168]
MIKKGSMVEVEHCKYIGSDIRVLFRGICIEDCNIGEHVDIRTLSGQMVKGVVYRDMYFCGNVHHLDRKAKEIIMIKSF